MIVRRNDEILLIERRKFPYGYAAPAGHVDDDPDYETSACRELMEEVGLVAEEINLVLEKQCDNSCRRLDGTWHHWKVYEVTVSGTIKASPNETKQAGWYGGSAVNDLAHRTQEYMAGTISENDWQSQPGLEVVWYRHFSELGILK